MPLWAKMIGAGAVLDAISDLIQITLDDNVVWVTGTNVEYAVYVEFGTSKMAAQPHLRPIARAVESDIPHIIRRADVETLADAIEAVAMEIERRLKATDSPVPVDTGRLKGSYEARPLRA